MSNRSRAAAGFVKTIVITPPENTRCKKKEKLEARLTFESMGSVREKVFASFVIKKWLASTWQ